MNAPSAVAVKPMPAAECGRQFERHVAVEEAHEVSRRSGKRQQPQLAAAQLYSD